jgi:30S ribosomal protein S31
MGKGDIKSKKGKIFHGSFGKRRQRKTLLAKAKAKAQAAAGRKK